MTELAFIASAKRHRSLIDTQHRLDRQRTDAAKLSEKAVLNSSRDAQLISNKIERDRQSLRDRLATRHVNALAKETLADQRHSKDVILGDIQFKNTRKEIADELVSSR